MNEAIERLTSERTILVEWLNEHEDTVPYCIVATLQNRVETIDVKLRFAAMYPNADK